MWLLLVAVSAVAWSIDGWLSPLRVTSSSMAPGLLGPHRHVTCSECSHEFDIDAAEPPPVNSLKCPRCGQTTDPTAAAVVQGERLFVNKAAFLFRGPRRWEPVVFRRNGELLVKRVVGLPGEEIEIRDGDVYANRQIVSKSWEQSQQLSIPVTDNAAPSRHRLVTQHLVDGLAIAPIFDDLPYNAAESRRLKQCRDIGLEFELEVSADEAVAIIFDTTRPEIQINIHPVKKRVTWKFAKEEKSGGQYTYASPSGNKLQRWSIARCDGQLWITCAGETLVSVKIPEGDQGTSSGRITFSMDPMRPLPLASYRIWRDIYYTNAPPTKNGQSREYPLGNDEYFVLGDNSSISEDSRHWEPYGVKRQDLIGRPIGLR